MGDTRGVDGLKEGTVLPLGGYSSARLTPLIVWEGNSSALDLLSKASENPMRTSELLDPSLAARVMEMHRRATLEMQAAREVQAGFFPRKLPQIESLAYAGVCMQARHVGGDCYDFLDLGPDRLGLVIADVAGKGIPAALLMATLQASLRCGLPAASTGLAETTESLEHLLGKVNRLFHEASPEASYASLFFAEYQQESRRLRYTNCGHPAPILLHGDSSVSRLESTCGVFGLFEGWQCRTATVELTPGDTLLLFTDGVTEALSEMGEQFGESRLVDLLLRGKQLTASGLLQTILDAVQGFSNEQLRDDITLVAAHCLD